MPGSANTRHSRRRDLKSACGSRQQAGQRDRHETTDDHRPPPQATVGRDRRPHTASTKDRRPHTASTKDRRRSGRRKSAADGGSDRTRPLTPWEEFQQHIKLIDDDTAMYKAPGTDPDPPAPLTTEQVAQQNTEAIKTRSSDTFSKVMLEFQLRKQQYLERQAALQRERERRAQEEAARGEALEEREEPEEEPEEEDFDFSDEDGEDAVLDPAILELRKSATRAWGIIRRHIQEKKMEKKNAGTTMNWNFLRQTLSHMTDMEKGRQTLYEKYLEKPNTWREGFVNFPDELFNKDKLRGRRGGAPAAPTSPKSKRGSSLKHKDGTVSRSSGIKSH